MSFETSQGTDTDIFFEMSLDMFCIASTDGFFLKVNGSFEKFLGYSEAELLQKPFADFIHRNDLESTYAQIELLKSGKQVHSFKNRYRCKSGSYKMLSWVARILPENGHIYASARDVSEEEDTKRTLDQIMAALNSKTIVATTDHKGSITDVNENFCSISGYGKDELLGKNHRILNSGVHSPEFFKDMWRSISKGIPWSGLIENRKKDGPTYFVQSVIAPITDLQDRITKYIAIRHDVTQHVLLREELERTLNILNETSDIAKVGGWELDIKSHELTWTDQTFLILEVDKREGQKPVLPEGLELFTTSSKPIIEEAIRRAIEHGESYSLELEALTAKGNKKWIYTNGNANYQNGEIVSLSGTIRDIDEWKQTEKKYVLERQKSIHNSKLASLGEMAAGIAHEINNPLSIIYGLTQLLEKREHSEEKQKEYIADISHSCERISTIVKSLQKFSRGNDRYEYAPCKLSKILEEAITLTRAKALRTMSDVSLNCESNAFILCNEVELEQVFVNLINNALDAVKDTKQKNVQLKLYETETTAFIEICDSGNGIPENIVENIFDPFFSTKSVREGTGLGLSISKGILEDHKGKIKLDSDAKNTCFLITLPIYTEGSDVD